MKQRCAHCWWWNGKRAIPGEFGECRFEHNDMFVKFPEEANVPLGQGKLLTADTFGCVDFVSPQ